MIVECFVNHEFLPTETGSKGYDQRRERIGIDCPKCGDKGITHVLYGTDNFYYCENPECKVTCHFDGGYYMIVDSGKKPVSVLINPDDVQIVHRIRKRSTGVKA